MPRERSLTSNGIYDYFVRFFSEARRPSKTVMFAFFAVFLIVPLLGEPSRGSAGQLESGVVFIGLNVVFYLTGIAVMRFNRDLDDARLRREGRGVLLVILVPITLYTLSAALTALLGNEVLSLLRATSSMVIVVPLLLVITVLVESVIRRGVTQSGSRVPLGLVFLTIFLMMYTFATIYFVNGLLVKTDATSIVQGHANLVAVNFEDALYFSGLIFTTLGSTDIFPVGPGKGVMLFESVTGYLVLGFLTAIFIQAIITARGRL
jgi:Ion channel